MYLAILVLSIIVTWRYADWKHWQKYQSTMLLFSFGNMLYAYVYQGHPLWMLKPEVLNSEIMDLIFTLSVYPLSALCFLSHYPEQRKMQLIHIVKYASIYSIFEFILFKMGMIEYRYGWNILWSVGFCFLMFPILILHHKKPLVANIICAVCFFLMNWIFPFGLG